MEFLEFKRKVKFITKFGRVLHSVGSPAHTLESTMLDMCRLLGIKGDIISLPTAIFSSFRDGEEEVTKIDRVEPVGVDLGKLSSVDLVSREVLEGKLSFEDALGKLEDILQSDDPYSKTIRVICFLFSAAGFMVLFGGSWGDLIASITVGMLMGLLNLTKKPNNNLYQLFDVLAAFVAALTTYLLAKLVPGLNIGIIIVSSLIIFMPGLFITIAISEIATQNLTSGTSRLVGGFMVLLKLTFGVFIGNKVATWFHYPSLNITFSLIPAWMGYVTLPITALMATVIFKAQKSDWKHVMMAGIFGYSCSKFGSHFLGPELGMFFGGACVGSAANIFARIMDRPSSIFQFPGMILLVPGSVGYRSLSFLFERNVVGGLDMAFTMVTLAMALVVGILVGNIFVKPRRSF